MGIVEHTIYKARCDRCQKQDEHVANPDKESIFYGWRKLVVIPENGLYAYAQAVDEYWLCPACFRDFSGEMNPPAKVTLEHEVE